MDSHHLLVDGNTHTAGWVSGLLKQPCLLAWCYVFQQLNDDELFGTIVLKAYAQA
jgi:hypothetical protein